MTATTLDPAIERALDQYALHQPEALANPYRLYAALRMASPVHWSDTLEAWVLTRYETVVFALRDARFSSRQRLSAFAQQLPPATQVEVKTLLRSASLWLGMTDPPNHTRLRSLVNRAFTPTMAEGMRPLIQTIVDDLLDSAHANSRMDVIGDLAFPLPILIIAEMLGVPASTRYQLKLWSDDVVSFLGAGRAMPDRAVAAQHSLCEFAEFFRPIIAWHRQHRSDNLISALISAEEMGDVLSEDELLATCIMLLFAGHETTTNLIGNGLLALLQHPDQWAVLADNPGLIEMAVEEMLRYDSPIQRTQRIAVADIELEGRRIRAGHRVMPLLGAANRDPAKFADPDQLNLQRQPNRHVAFGYGVHFCVGAPLARVEGQVAISTVVQRLAQLRMASTDLQWHANMANRGLLALPVEF
jgi:cytochrome P450